MKTGQTYCYLKWSLWALMTIFVIGCQTEDVGVNNVLPAECITFGAAVYEGSAVRTRTLELNDIKSDTFDIDFFIQLDYVNPKTSATESEIKRYRVADLYAGRLDAKDKENSDKRLNWKDATSDHTFYAWTLPWLTEEEGVEYADEKEKAEDADGAEEVESCLKKYYDEKGDPIITVVFHDSGEGTDYDQHHNNAILEKFIGAQKGPYKYRDQGTYVPLTFYHLVSQIRLGKLTVIRSDGSRHEDLKANLTFIGMPKTAKFDPHPYKYISNPHPAEWRTYSDWDDEDTWKARLHHPVVIGPEDGYEEDSEVTFFIPESAPDGRPGDRFYVCPEIDFSKLVYKVVITSVGDDVLETGIEYYGNFSKVQFTRINKTDYDKGDKTDDTVLHAGEMMTLNITLYPGVGPGASIVIQDWNDAQPTEALQHAHKGVYTDGEAQRLVDVFGDSKATQEEIDNLYDLYGETVGDEKVFKLYENVKVNGSNFPVGEGYVVDGMGHTLTMSSASNTVTVGNVRDVYITDGKNTIWVDPEGNIWKLDTTTNEFEKTDYKLKNSGNTKINLTTGAVS